MNDHDIVERYDSPGVMKFVHANGMETTVKTVPTCGGNDNKAVMFISSSVGCQQKCKFCYLTTKKFPYTKVSDDMIVEACKAVLDSIDISDKYLKLSFMGMGDALAEDISIYAISMALFHHAVIKNKLCMGIDGVDVGTSVPAKYSLFKALQINHLNEFLSDLSTVVPFNPKNDYSTRSFVRVFISLHSMSDSVRFYMMPLTSTMAKINKFIESLDEKVNVHFHTLLLKGVNDTPMDVLEMLQAFQWYKYKGRELRLLRFNKCDKSPYEESPNIDLFVQSAKDYKINFKYQTSAGSEIKSACGQFICKTF